MNWRIGKSGFDSKWTQKLPSSQMRPERLWTLPTLLTVGLLFPGEGGRDVKLTNHSHLVSKDGKDWSYTPTRHHAVVLNWAQKQLYFTLLYFKRAETTENLGHAEGRTSYLYDSPEIFKAIYWRRLQGAWRLSWFGIEENMMVKSSLGTPRRHTEV